MLTLRLQPTPCLAWRFRPSRPVCLVAVLFEGHVAGFNISGLNYGAALYVSNNTGALADAAGTTNLPAGKVVPMTDKDRTKVLYFKGSTL